VRVRFLAAQESRARTDIVVHIRAKVIQIKARETGIGRVVPVTTADRQAPHSATPLFIARRF